MSKETITNTPLQIIKELQIKVNDLSDEVARLTARAEAAEVEISSIYAMPLFFYDSPRPPLVVFLTKKFNEIFTNRDKWKKRAKLFREAYKDKDVEAFNLGWHKTAIENCLSEAKEEGQQLRQSLAALEAELKDEKANHDSLKHILSALEIMMRDEVALLSKEDPDFADGSIASTLTALMTYTRRITSENSRLTLELESARAKAREFATHLFCDDSIVRNGWILPAFSPTRKEAADYLLSAGVLIWEPEKGYQFNPREKDDNPQRAGWYRLPSAEPVALPAADEIGGDE